MKNLFDTIMTIIMVMVFGVIIWFFFVYMLIIGAVVFCVAFLAFVFGVIPVNVTFEDGTKRQYRISDVIELWRSR
jgi:hypothetical protein